MKDLQLCQEIVNLGRTMGADEIEVFYHKENKVEVMVEKNDLQIPKGDNYEGIGVRVIKDQKVGFATTNLLDQESIRLTLRGALDIAEMSTASPFNQLPDPQLIGSVAELTDPAGFGLNMENAVKKAGKIIEVFKEYPKVTLDSAVVKGVATVRAIANSKNVAAREESTLYESSLLCFAVDGDDITSFDMDFIGSTKLADLDFEERLRELAKRQMDSLGASSIPSFNGQVILAPSAIQSIIQYPLIQAIKGDMVVNGISPLKDKLGEVIASPLFTLVDDATLPGGYASCAFDREGTPTKRLPIISKGRLESFIYDHKTALKAGTTSTGHAIGDNRSINLNSSNVIIESGEVSLDEMIKGLKRGVLISRFSGNSDPTSGDFSGVVKGGFYIEDGQIVKPIKEVMVAGNIYTMLHDLLQVSKEQINIFNSYLPYLLFDKVSITGK